MTSDSRSLSKGVRGFRTVGGSTDLSCRLGTPVGQSRRNSYIVLEVEKR